MAALVDIADSVNVISEVGCSGKENKLEDSLAAATHLMGEIL
jgi:hypothetical protein